MRHRQRSPWLAAGFGIVIACGAAVPGVRAADLGTVPVVPAPAEARRAVAPRVQAYRYVWPDPGPASTSGYYGYYGTDIQGEPYYGLYSEDVTCLRSAITPDGYRVVDACRNR